MATEIIMPKLGLTMTEGTVDEWAKQEGNPVKKGEVVCTISSEKLTYDVEAPMDGVLIKILVPAGEDAPCQAPIGYIGEPGEQVDGEKENPKTEPVVAGKEESAREMMNSEVMDSSEKTSGTRVFITPLARKIAAEKGIDFKEINGTGGNGRITRRDVEAYVPAAKPVAAPRDTVAIGKGLKGMRKTIAQRMVASLHTTAQLTIHQKADITALMTFREEMKVKSGVPLVDGQLSLNTLVTRAVILALKETPSMNAWYKDGTYEEVNEIHIGMAVALDEGLVVPVIKNAANKTLTELGKSLNSVIHDTRQGTLSGDLYTGSTFTITNLGKSGVEYFTPIINSPEIGILGVGTMLKELALAEDNRVIQIQKLPLSLTFDHQIIDGTPAAEFLGKIIYYLEHPYLLVI